MKFILLNLAMREIGERDISKLRFIQVPKILYLNKPWKVPHPAFFQVNIL
jgi:hypothetical protein